MYTTNYVLTILQVISSYFTYRIHSFGTFHKRLIDQSINRSIDQSIIRSFDRLRQHHCSLYLLSKGWLQVSFNRICYVNSICITHLFLFQLKLKVQFMKVLPDAFIVLKNCSMEVPVSDLAESILLAGAIAMAPASAVAVGSRGSRLGS